MGGSLSAKVLFIGLDNAGKTSFVTCLEEGAHDFDTKPTVGFDTKDVKYSGVRFTVYDVAGNEKVRDLWKHYYADADAVVWVVDSTDPERFEEGVGSLSLALKDPNMRKDIPLLVACNKSGSPNSKDPEQIKEGLKLNELLTGRNWHILPTNAKTADGVVDSFKWLGGAIKDENKKKKKALKEKK
eukprot:TRINITY_DN30_c0_g1_i1.p1 TRINITY_DN30_c0_g1~~TRINITY_DN30_c0_g1_i1.p1  ORF type:complete len:185 (-),score=48.81 TRINITY_DN30_c0_g1_i1:87-641(-)